MSDTSNKTISWAQRGKQAINAVEYGDDVGGNKANDPFAFFYNYIGRGNKVAKPNQRFLADGTVIEGTYEGSYDVTTKYGTSTNHKFRTSEGLVSLSGQKAGTGQLNKKMASIASGKQCKVTYTGMKPIEGGEYDGTMSHTFLVQLAKE